MATAAQAQVDPYTPTERNATQNDVDTDYTPVAKEANFWNLYHGAEFGDTEVVEGSATSFDTDLYDVSFKDFELGLAGGSRCPITPVRDRKESAQSFGERVRSCTDEAGQESERVPVLYRYVQPPNEDERWERVALEGDSSPGYIGAIAWLDADRALIVGGTGIYPERELGPTQQDQYGHSNAIQDPTDPDKADVAGKGRAWVYDSRTDSAEEVDLSALTEDEPDRAGMRGMTALECLAAPLCVAGALGQIWEWENGAFVDERFDAQSNRPGAKLFRYRVRDISGIKGCCGLYGYNGVNAYTAGCCAASELENTPRWLQRSGTGFGVGWRVNELGGPYCCGLQDPRNDTFPGNLIPRDLADEQVTDAISQGSQAYDKVRELNDKPAWPDSVYAAAGDSSGDTIVLTPGAPEGTSGAEKASVITRPGDPSPHETDLARPALSTARLVDIDDDAVGELRSTAIPGLGARGLVVANIARPAPESAVDTSPTPEDVATIGAGWEPVDQERLKASIAARHYLLPSYSANAIDIIGPRADGWAVGDHGAILRLTEDGRGESGLEPRPPKLGSPKPKPLSDRDAFEDARPEVAETTGTVPPIGAQTIEVDEPQMVPVGPSGVNGEVVVMSRDGSEGWALYSTRKLSHYENGVWTPCYPSGIEGVAPPDPECEALAELVESNFVDARGARIPYENDSDPSNDDRFEVVVANGNNAIRYDGRRWERWDVPGTPENVRSLAFVSPTDAWLTARGFFGSLYHLEAKRWVDCTSGRCSDEGDRFISKIGDTVDLVGVAAAGSRVYAFGRRIVGLSATRFVPFIVYRDPGEIWTDGSGPGGDRAGFDPGFSNPATPEMGRVHSLSVAQRADGSYEGWAVGAFGSGIDDPLTDAAGVKPFAFETALMRLGADGWRRFASPGAFDDYMLPRLREGAGPRTNQRLQVTYPSDQGDGAFIAASSLCLNNGCPTFGYNSTRKRFQLLDRGRPDYQGEFTALAPDAQGGFWGSALGYMFHYTDRVPKPLFEDVPNPAGVDGEKLREIEGGGDGSVWLSTDSDRLYRYDRIGGWEAVQIGWEPPGSVLGGTAPEDIAIGPGGEGLAVGPEGRIADLSAQAVALNPAAGRSCLFGDPVPCGTSRDLNAVDIAPDGSAIAAGDRLSILWRAPGGEFGMIAKPRIPASSAIEMVSYPSPERAYLYTSTGVVLEGRMSSPGEWSWQNDNTDEDGEIVTVDHAGKPFVFADFEIDARGHGYAVGDGGLIWERTEEGVWRRFANRWATPCPCVSPGAAGSDLTSVELSATGEEGVLFGGASGAIFTVSEGELSVARPEDWGNGFGTGPVLGFAYLPGTSEGSVDAWAAIAEANRFVGGDDRLLRYRSDPDDASLDPAAAVSALADAPPGVEGELSVGAFGKSECHLPEKAQPCPDMAGATTTNELTSQRIVDALAERREAGAFDLALMSGDAVDTPGYHATTIADLEQANPPTSRAKHERFDELVAQELEERVAPFFAAIGGQDVSDATIDDGLGHEQSTKQIRAAGENYGWREGFAGRAEPWGDGSGALDAEGELEFVPADGSRDGGVRYEDLRYGGESVDGGEVEVPKVADLPSDPVPRTLGQTAENVNNTLPDEAGGRTVRAAAAVPGGKVALGGAATHYAVDVLRDGEPIARIVVVDTSLGSLAAADPLQQPIEAGGQIRFLERMICKRGDVASTGNDCTREPNQRAIVVSNTPTYSYGPGAVANTAADAGLFESLMLRHDVDLVISGALGYNGLYYTFAPGIHEPCPGGDHPERAPSGVLPSCGAVPSELTDPTQALADQGLGGAYPTLIASGAGGKFGPNGDLPADGPAGQWHGYSIARLMPDGEVVVEQRPLLDWIGLDAAEHTLGPRERLRLRGWGRSPISTRLGGASTAFHYEISNAAITHRYELLLADPDEPWLPCEAADAGCASLQERLAGTRSLGSARDDMDGACEPYLCLPENVATIDRLSGEVRAGGGKYPDTFAVAMLSAGEKVATWPLVFKRSPSFVVFPVTASPAIPGVPAGAGSPPPPPAPPNPPQPSVPQASLPQALLPPGVPPLSAAQPPEPAPPAPPAPPPPTEQPSPLSLTLAPPGIAIATPTAVIQPPTPPVNPAPPGGARREARQRQAAAQKSGADSDKDSVGEESANSGDLANAPFNPSGAGMTRHDPARAERHNFTALNRTDTATGAQPVLYAGGITLLAALLAVGWIHGRPTPRRRSPELPAPAFARANRRR